MEMSQEEKPCMTVWLDSIESMLALVELDIDEATQEEKERLYALTCRARAINGAEELRQQNIQAMSEFERPGALSVQRGSRR
jgi:hypothetical protein